MLPDKIQGDLKCKPKERRVGAKWKWSGGKKDCWAGTDKKKECWERDGGDKHL